MDGGAFEVFGFVWSGVFDEKGFHAKADVYVIC